MRTLAIAMLMLVPVGASAAAERVLRVDPEESSVTFRLRATLHTVNGSFAVRATALRFDADSGILAGEIVVDAASGETGNGKRDRKMHAKVLESGAHPGIVFRLGSFTGKLEPPSRSRIEVSGVLELRGDSHDLTVPVEVSFEGTTVRAESSFTVPYVDWGLPDPSSFLLRVRKTVDVQVALVALIETPAP
jgi:polyisoprenoid-binding protein YceI